MSTRVLAAPADGFFKRATVRETAVLLVVAWLVPFVVHLLPWSGDRPLGAHLLPLFWTAFVAVYLYGLRVGVLVGLFAPAINLALTGLPALPRLAQMSFEVTVFVLVTWLIVRRRATWWLAAPLGYVVAKLAATLLLALTGESAGGMWAAVPISLFNALPGLVVLAAVNFAVSKYYPKPGGDGLDDAAGV